MSDNVRNFLDISTGHLMTSTRERLEGDALPGLSIMSHGFGWLVRVPSEFPGDELEGLSQDLLTCLTAARRRNCDYILFDRDANADEELPFYEDNHVATVRVRVRDSVEYDFDMPLTQKEAEAIKVKPELVRDLALAYFASSGPKHKWIAATQSRRIEFVEADPAEEEEGQGR